MKVICMNCGVKNYMKVDYRRYHRSYETRDATFESHTSLNFFLGFLFAAAKVASITVIIYFHNIP